MKGLKSNENLLEIKLSDFFRIDSIKWINEFKSGTVGVEMIYCEQIDLSKHTLTGSRIGKINTSMKLSNIKF